PAAPPGIVRSHRHDKRRNLLHDTGTPGPLRPDGPLPRDQPLVPAQHRVGRHDRRHLPQDPATEPVAPRREAATLVVGQPYPPPSELLNEDTVLLYQVLDHLLLLAVDPSS